MSYIFRYAKYITYLANNSGFLDAYSHIKSNLESQIVIIFYHRVGLDKYKSPMIVPNSEFEKQCQYLLKSHKIMSLSELIQNWLENRPLPKKVAIITFDDGYKDNYIHAFPILKKYKIPATIFLTSGHIGTDNLFWFDKIEYIILNSKLKHIELDGFGEILLDKKENRLQVASNIIEKLKRISEEDKNKLIENLIKSSEVDIPLNVGKETILSWDEVKDMNESGIDFGAHTVTHPILKNISLKEAKYEIVFSKKTIESRLGQTVCSFSYPNGRINDFDEQIVDIVKKAGFKCAVTTTPKMITPKNGLYTLGRLSSIDNFNLFKFRISGLYTDLNGLSWRKK